jgi:hypothetical protein
VRDPLCHPVAGGGTVKFDIPHRVRAVYGRVRGALLFTDRFRRCGGLDEMHVAKPQPTESSTNENSQTTQAPTAHQAFDVQCASACLSTAGSAMVTVTFAFGSPRRVTGGSRGLAALAWSAGTASASSVKPSPMQTVRIWTAR